MPINAHIQVHVLYLYKHTCIYIYVERDLLGQNLQWDKTSFVRGQGSDIISRMKPPVERNLSVQTLHGTNL